MLLETPNELDDINTPIDFQKKKRIDGTIGYLMIAFIVLGCFAMLVAGMGRVQKFSDDVVGVNTIPVVEPSAEISEDTKSK